MCQVATEGKKRIYGLLLVPTSMMAKADRVRINQVPWTQFQMRTYSGEMQAYKANEAFINRTLFEQTLDANQLDDIEVEICQSRHDEDRIIYDVYEDKDKNTNFYFVLFDEDKHDMDGANLDNEMNISDALETLNFSITRFSVY
jgi:hypothetical protein